MLRTIRRCPSDGGVSGPVCAELESKRGLVCQRRGRHGLVVAGVGWLASGAVTDSEEQLALVLNWVYRQFANLLGDIAAYVAYGVFLYLVALSYLIGLFHQLIDIITGHPI
jgi:hypothetical protein